MENDNLIFDGIKSKLHLESTQQQEQDQNKMDDDKQTSSFDSLTAHIGEQENERV